MIQIVASTITNYMYLQHLCRSNRVIFQFFIPPEKAGNCSEILLESHIAEANIYLSKDVGITKDDNSIFIICSIDSAN